ncbi:hypothetical protein HSBAA_56210 [Vreelandella sulfidaeris]|uniref:FAD synthase n=1 Tax=Vreelandella sulfidaeris TaxID=115553 RepID=A0A455UE01_9GAMM|nr:hypothetical protein HSBAA_56210 [Halomonas sulfidaeris]
MRLLRDFGAEQVLVLPFNDALRSLTGREFIDQVLIDGLGVKHLVVGDDFRFGCDRRGDFALLAEVGREQGFGVEHTRTFTVDDERVSSSRVRTCWPAGIFLPRHVYWAAPTRYMAVWYATSSWGVRLACPPPICRCYHSR